MSKEPAYARCPIVWDQERVNRLWTYYASNPSYRSQYFSSHAGQAIVGAADDVIGLRGKRILDFGCGRGDLLGHLFQRGLGADGMEFGEGSLAEVRERFREEPRLGALHLVGAEPVGEIEGYDVVFMVEVIEHVLDDQLDDTLHRVASLLVPGGHLVVTTPNDEDIGASMIECPCCGVEFHRWQHVRRFDRTSLPQLLARHDLHVVRCAGLDWTATRVRRVVRRLRRPLTPSPAPHLFYVGRRA